MLRVSTFTDLSNAGLQAKGKVKKSTRTSTPKSRGVRFSSASSCSDHVSLPPSTHQFERRPVCDGDTSSVSSSSWGACPSRPTSVVAGTRSKRPSVLLMASTAGDATWLQQCLCSSGALEVNQHGPEGLAPLHMATKHGHLACMECLLNWPQTDAMLVTIPDEKTALHYAVDAKQNRVKCLKLLLQHGLPVNQCDKNLTTPLHYAAMLGRTAALIALVESGADVAAVDVNGLRPVDVAMMWGKRDCARRLKALQWAAEKTQAEDQRRLSTHCNRLARVQRTRQQKAEQAVRGEEAFTDWLSLKGLSTSSSASLARHHTTSSLLHEQGQSSSDSLDRLSDGQSAVPQRSHSQMSSRFNSMWSVYSAPAKLSTGSAPDRDAISALTSPSLPTLVDSQLGNHVAAKPIRISFRSKHQHRDFGHLQAQKSQHLDSSPKSSAKRIKRPGPSAATATSKGSHKRRRLPRTSTPHPSQAAAALPEEEAMAVCEENRDLPRLRIEELLLKDRNQLPQLKASAWSADQLSGMQGEESSPGSRSSLAPPVHRPLRANSLRLAALRTATLDAVAEEDESTSSSLSDLDAYLGPTHSCLHLQCVESMDSPYSVSDLSHCSGEMLDRMSLSDD